MDLETGLCPAYGTVWRREKWLTFISQLVTDHCCLPVAPSIVTYCTPVVVDAQLHTTLAGEVSTHEPNGSIGTRIIWI